MKKHRITFLPNRDFRVGCPQRHTLCRLRRENKAWRFAGIKLALLSNVAINLYIFLPAYWEQHGSAGWWMHDLRGVDYVFIANFWASLLMFGLLIPTLFRSS